MFRINSSDKCSNGGNAMKNLLQRLWKDESAQGMTEYIMIVALIVVVVMMFGGKFKTAISEGITKFSTSFTSGIGQTTD